MAANQRIIGQTKSFSADSAGVSASKSFLSKGSHASGVQTSRLQLPEVALSLHPGKDLRCRYFENLDLTAALIAQRRNDRDRNGRLSYFLTSMGSY